MFDQLKQLAKFKAIQDAVKKEKFESSREWVKVVINGDLTLEEIILNPALTIDQQTQMVKACFNEALKKAQMGVAQKLAGLM